MRKTTPNLERQRSHPLHEGERGQTTDDLLHHLRHEVAYRRAARQVAGSDVLEVGCNTGHGTVLLAEEAAHVIAVDVSAEAIRLAKERYPITNVEFRVTDGTTLSLLELRPRFALLFQLIEHVEDARQFLEGLKSVLAPNSVVLLTTPNAALRLRKGQKPWNPFHVREYRVEELRTLLTSVFGSCEITGLFGIPEVHERERRRVAQSWAKVNFWDPVRFAIRWDWIQPRGKYLWERMLGGRSARREEPAGNYSTDSFFFSQDNLGEALDFYAVAPAPRV